MIVQIDKSFVKDTQRIKDQRILNRITSSLKRIKEIDSLEKINGIKKLKGESGYYRLAAIR